MKKQITPLLIEDVDRAESDQKTVEGDCCDRVKQPIGLKKADFDENYQDYAENFSERKLQTVIDRWI